MLSGEKEKLSLEGKPSPSERGLGHGTLLPSTGHIPTRATAGAPWEWFLCQMPSEPPAPPRRRWRANSAWTGSQALIKYTHTTH